MKKKKSVAIFGSGLFALFLAGEIEKKAYPLTVFCEEANLSAFLRAAAPFLDEMAFADELGRLKTKDICFEFGCTLSGEFYAEKCGGFDVLCASAAAARGFFPDAVCDERYMLCAARSLVMGEDGSDVLSAAFSAKKAALTVDRLAQRLAPDNMRGSEGAVETKLYASLDNVGSLHRVECGAEGYTREEAIEEAKRCIQCRCDECMKAWRLSQAL